MENSWRSKVAVALVIAAVCIGLLAAYSKPAQAAGNDDQYEIYALLMGGPIEMDAPHFFWHTFYGQKVGVNFYFWALKGNKHNILVDSGFSQRRAEVYGWKFPASREQMLGRIGLKPEDIDIVIASHLHFDHFIDPEIYSKAVIYIQKKEMEFFCGQVQSFPSIMGPPDGGHLTEASEILEFVKKSGQVRYIDGDQEIVPGVKAIWGGAHSPGHQSVLVDTPQGQVMIAVDNMDYYKNFEQRIPVGHLINVTEWMDIQSRFEIFARNGVYLLPSHDPLVTERFPEVAKKVFHISLKDEKK